MLYRILLGVLLVVALILTLNERMQEERARRNSETALAAPSSAIARSGGFPAPAARPAPTVRFEPHRVRTRGEVQLLEEPRDGAAKIEPLGLIPPGIPVMAMEERGGWYYIDARIAKGWARMEEVDEP